MQCSICAETADSNTKLERCGHTVCADCAVGAIFRAREYRQEPRCNYNQCCSVYTSDETEFFMRADPESEEDLIGSCLQEETHLREVESVHEEVMDEEHVSPVVHLPKVNVGNTESVPAKLMLDFPFAKDKHGRDDRTEKNQARVGNTNQIGAYGRYDADYLGQGQTSREFKRAKSPLAFHQDLTKNRDTREESSEYRNKNGDIRGRSSEYRNKNGDFRGESREYRDTRTSQKSQSSRDDSFKSKGNSRNDIDDKSLRNSRSNRRSQSPCKSYKEKDLNRKSNEYGSSDRIRKHSGDDFDDHKNSRKRSRSPRGSTREREKYGSLRRRFKDYSSSKGRSVSPENKSRSRKNISREDHGPITREVKYSSIKTTECGVRDSNDDGWKKKIRYESETENTTCNQSDVNFSFSDDSDDDYDSQFATKPTKKEVVDTRFVERTFKGPNSAQLKLMSNTERMRAFKMYIGIGIAERSRHLQRFPIPQWLAPFWKDIRCHYCQVLSKKSSFKTLESLDQHLSSSPHGA